MRGIYSLEGDDRLSLCLSETARPTEFISKASSDAVLVRLKRMTGSPELRTSKAPLADGDARLVGKWEIVESDQKGTVEFTKGGTVIFIWLHSGLKRDWTETGQYGVVAGNQMKIKAAGEYGGESVRGFEFLSEDELLINKASGTDFTWLFGRLRRVK